MYKLYGLIFVYIREHTTEKNCGFYEYLRGSRRGGGGGGAWVHQGRLPCFNLSKPTKKGGTAAIDEKKYWYLYI